MREKKSLENSFRKEERRERLDIVYLMGNVRGPLRWTQSASSHVFLRSC